MFRRKPAITRLGLHFTTFHNSSENIATFTRSILYNLVMERSPGFGSNKSNLPNISNPKKYSDSFFFKLLSYLVAFARALNLATFINLLHLIPIFSYRIRLYLQLKKNVRLIINIFFIPFYNDNLIFVLPSFLGRSEVYLSY